MTVDDVKGILNIAAEDDTFDEQIEALLGDSIDSLETEVNFEFELDEEDDKIVPSGLKRVIAFDILSLLRGQSEEGSPSALSLGDYSITFASKYVEFLSSGGRGVLNRDYRNRIVNSYRRAGAW